MTDQSVKNAGACAGAATVDESPETAGLRPDEGLEECISKMCRLYSLDEASARRFVGHMRPFEVRRGQIMMREGVSDDRLCLVRRGIVRSFIYRDGEPQTVWFAAEGEFVMQIWSYVRCGASRENIEAVTDCELLAISKVEIDRLCNESLEFSNIVRRLFEGHAAMMEDFTLFFMLNASAEERYLALMRKAPDIMQQVSLKTLASYIAVTPQSLSRIRARLRNRWRRKE